MNLESAIADIKADEGFRKYAYRDHLGYLTIGYGFLIDERKGGAIPDPVADMWLRVNVAVAIQDLDKIAPFWRDAPEPVQGGLLNMAYQLGGSGLGKFKKMLAALEQGDYQTAADEALDSKWAEQTPKRAQRIAGLFKSAQPKKPG